MATRSQNPVLGRIDFGAQPRVAAEPMTLGGVVRKTGVLLALAAAAAAWTWHQVLAGGLSGNVGTMMLVGALGGFGVAWYTARNPERAAVTGPIYAVLEGLLLGAISALMNARYAGLPLLAVALTMCTLGVMLVLYRAGLVRATERFKTIVVSCTAAIAVFYLIVIVAGLFGVAPPPFLWQSGAIGIGFSLFVTGLAAFNLILDFDLIERGLGHDPAEYEWFAAFGLVVTLFWLYIEMLRLLGKLRR
ncbi:MAG TPA: Bax inhibitor-1/YccA family protein [Gemmatimonadales bacterium]|nr:Bax inhibitor-1/YccA family protein [Gemmatimonadales bacterium]